MRATTRLRWALDRSTVGHDLVTTSGLRAEGLETAQIQMLVADGLIERIIRGLYRRGGSRTSMQDIAAALQRHPRAVASHLSALYIHGLDVSPPPTPHFTMPVGSAGWTRLGIQHRSPLDPLDVTRRRGLPVTTIPRSLVDAAEYLSVDALSATANEIFSGKLARFEHVGDSLARAERAPGRSGGGRIRQVMAGWCDAIQPDSPAEAAAIRLVVASGLPAPTTQFVLVDRTGEFVARLDMAWPDERVAREYDSVKWHPPDRIEADELRRQRIEALGWTVESVHRHHVSGAGRGWLDRLGRDLGRAERRAS